MDAVTLHFEEVEDALEEVHNLFSHWMTEKNGFDESQLYRTRLVLHEWLANLAQHADFQNRAPDISVCIQPEGNNLRCVIEDNSRGFNLDRHWMRPSAFDTLPERGMGLHIIKACTAKLDYARLGGGRHRLEFVVPAEECYG